MSTGPGQPAPMLAPAEAEALRSEHDRLALQVATRRSIDDVRRGAYAAFGVVITGGLAIKFAWDRWGWGPRPARPPGRYPLLFLAALAVAIVLLAVAVGAFRRARSTMVVEDRDFARLREIRGRLGIDA
jgi:hypothetical protein